MVYGNNASSYIFTYKKTGKCFNPVNVRTALKNGSTSVLRVADRDQLIAIARKVNGLND